MTTDHGKARELVQTWMREDLAAKPAPVVTPEQLDLIRRTIAEGATPDELKLYLYDCARQGVHPLDKLIHFTKRKNQKTGKETYTPITSIDFMRIRAAETGEMAGSDDAVYTGEIGKPGFEAKVIVWRLTDGTRYPYSGTARWTEYKPEFHDFMWRKMPHLMLGKCAEALALRKAFPKQLAGLYAKEEMDQAGASEPVAPDPPATVVDVTTGEAVARENRPTPPEGYRYIDEYREEGGWHHVGFYGAKLDGSAEYFKTKLGKVGEAACLAYQEGVPVKIETKPNDKAGEEGWLNKITRWKPAELAIHEAPVEPGDIPF